MIHGFKNEAIPDANAMYLVISTSLHPDSKSRVLANAAHKEIKDQGGDCELIDLAYGSPLPMCNGHDCYSDPNVGSLAQKITEAKGVLLASPVYNFDVSASCKNLVELTGSAWNEKVVGFLCAAGGQGSYMSPMSMANSLMLDFRCLILPRFIYAAGDECIVDGEIKDTDLLARVDELAKQMVKVAGCL